jgi:hypothetical protein
MPTTLVIVVTATLKDATTYELKSGTQFSE